MATLPMLSEADYTRARMGEQENAEGGFGALRSAGADGRGLPLESLTVQARLDGLFAAVTLGQCFVNDGRDPIEAVYVFPLPDRFAVTDFRLECAGRVVLGQLRERQAARREYAAAKRAGHRAALAEEDRPGVFTVSVGQLPPGERATVRLTMTGTLPFDDGQATFRFPLVVAPRYIPGKPSPTPRAGAGLAADTDAVPDASRITPPTMVRLPGWPSPIRLSLAVELAADSLAGSAADAAVLASSLHAVSTTESDGLVRVAVQPGDRLDRDFVLRLRLAEEAGIRRGLTIRPDEPRIAVPTGGKAASPDGEGTFALTLFPPRLALTGQRPRDVVILLDRSGSMDGWKMVAARQAVAQLVDGLGPADRFEVVAFDDELDRAATLLRDGGLANATHRNRTRQLEWLAAVESQGGTELAAPLEEGLDTLQRQSAARDRILLLITDGQVGNEDQILAVLGPRAKGLRVFTLGVDSAVNEAFLRRLAMLGGGRCEVAESWDRVEAAVTAVRRRIATPVLSKLSLTAQGLELLTETVTPARLPDMFADSPLTVLGRYRGRPAGEAALVLSGEDATGRSWSARVPAVPAGAADGSASAALPTIWARAALRDGEDRWAADGSSDDKLQSRLTALSLRWGVLCRFTAFVAVDRAERMGSDGKLTTVVQPVALPAGWEEDDDSAASAFSSKRMIARGFVAGGVGGVGGARRSQSGRGVGGARKRSAPFLPPGSALYCVMPAAIPAPSSGEPLHSLSDSMPCAPAESVERETAEAGPPDLSAYRQRAGELLARLRAGAASADPSARLTAVLVLLRQLRELIDDLRSVGTPAAELARLDATATELTALGAAPSPADLARVSATAEAALAAFAEGRA